MPIVNTPTYPHKVTGMEIILGILARGTINKTRTYQTTMIEKSGGSGIMERVQLQYPYHVPNDPKTPGQLAQRAKMGPAVLSWQNSSPEEKGIWNAKWKKEYAEREDHPDTFKCRSGYILYIQDYLNKH